MRNCWKVETVVALFLCLLLPACGNLGATGGHRAEFLITLTSVSPSSVMAGSPTFTLTVKGTNLSTSGILVWNGGKQIIAVTLSSSEATFTIDASLIANPGSISLQFVDGINSNELSNALTLTVAPRGPTACALFGTYDFLFAGFGMNYSHVIMAGAFGVDVSGNVAGEADYPWGGATLSGTCTNSGAPNVGTLSFNEFNSEPNTLNYTFVLQQQGSGGTRGRLFEVGENTSPFGTLSGSGMFVEASPDSVLGGDYAFGLVGEDPSGANGVGSQVAAVGRITYSKGTLNSGFGDINDGGTVTANGTVTALNNPSPPDIWGRTQWTLSIEGQSFPMVLYLNSSGIIFAFGNVFPPSSSSMFVAGFFSPQSSAGSYSNSSLNGPLVFDTQGAPPPLCCWTTNPSSTDTTIGSASGFDGNSGTFNLLFDNVSGGVANLNQTVTGATYSVASNGRATVSYTSGGETREYVYYLDNVNDGYILGLDNSAEFGFFQPQASGPFNTASVNGTFAMGTFFPSLPGSPNLTTEVTLNNGNLTASAPSGALSGTYSITAAGRGTATVNLPVLGGNDLVLYVIDSQSVVLMGSDNTTADAITLMHF